MLQLVDRARVGASAPADAARTTTRHAHQGGEPDDATARAGDAARASVHRRPYSASHHRRGLDGIAGTERSRTRTKAFEAASQSAAVMP